MFRLAGNPGISRSPPQIIKGSSSLTFCASRHARSRPISRRFFYALREVADRFDVSLSLVAAVYRQLESEGLLTRRRGSRTLLQGRGAERQLSVRGIVGVPMPLSSFLPRQKSRMFFMSIQRELHRRGFAAVGLFLKRRKRSRIFFSKGSGTARWTVCCGICRTVARAKPRCS